VGEKGNVVKLGMSDVYLMEGSSAQKDDLDTALDHYDPIYRRYSAVPLNILYPYGCADADYTLSLKYVFEPMLQAESLLWVFRNITMRLQHELTLMELHGVPLDLARAKQVEADQHAIMAQCNAEAHRLIGRSFDLGSPDQVGKLLFDELGLPGGTRGKAGWTTDSDALEGIDHPVVKQILRFRRAQKIQGTYASAFLKEVTEITNDGQVGWIHMTYYPDTVTGRLRGSDPSLLTLPKPEKGGMIVKSMLAGGEDYRFVFKDYSQIELKFIAHCSGEPVWVEGFNAGYDMHAAMAQRIWHPDLSVSDIKSQYPEDRSKAKTVNFGIAYGESVWSLAKELGLSFDDADKLINYDYFGAAPVLKAWIDRVQGDAKRDGYVHNIWGRRRHLPDATLPEPLGMPWPDNAKEVGCYRRGPELSVLNLEVKDLENLQSPVLRDMIKNLGNGNYKFCTKCDMVKSCLVNGEKKRVKSLIGRAMRQAINAPIQGGAADMVNLALILIAEELRNQRLDAAVVMNIHDELCVYSHTSCVDQVDRIMDYYMCDYMQILTQFRVPITVDTSIVHRWSDKHLKE
jgi:DNA polymerase I-like protein with 3'-5' exonuclease and polymerase domains